MIKIYTDGSFTRLMPDYYGYGCVIYLDDKILIELQGLGNEFIESHQIGGECEAVLKGLEYCLEKPFINDHSEIEILYDYIGIYKWISGQWKTSKPVSIAFVKAFNELKEKFDVLNIDIKFTKIKAHSGVSGNEIADNLANSAIKNKKDDK